MGDCVAWNPEMAPQATVMNISGQIGIFCGCRFAKTISGMTWPPTPASIAPMMPNAMTMRQTPKIG